MWGKDESKLDLGNHGGKTGWNFLNMASWSYTKRIIQARDFGSISGTGGGRGRKLPTGTTN